MRSCLTKLGIFTVFAVFLSGCFSDTILYNQKITGRFNNHDFAFLKEKYPMILNAKGASNNQMRADLIKVMHEEYIDMHRFKHATFVSALDFQEKQEISFVINVNPAEGVAARNICSDAVPLLQNQSEASLINSAQVAFCRQDKAWSHITTQFNQPVTVTSEDFRDAINLAAHSILYKNNNPFVGCGTPPTKC